MKNTSTSTPITTIALAFLAGALIPAISLYLTGGSNRFMFVFGLILGMISLLLPIVLYPKTISRWILAVNEACEQFAQVIRQHGALSVIHHVDSIDAPAPKTNLEVAVAKDDKSHVILGHEANPYVEDCVTALRNLGVTVNKAKRTVKGLVEVKEYGTFDELLRDAVEMARRG